MQLNVPLVCTEIFLLNRRAEKRAFKNTHEYVDQAKDSSNLDGYCIFSLRIMCTALIYINVSNYTEKSYLNMCVSRDYVEVTVSLFCYVQQRKAIAWACSTLPYAEACYGIKPHELIDNNACIINDLIGRVCPAAHDRVLASF